MKRFVMATVLLLTLTACGGGSDSDGGGDKTDIDKTDNGSTSATPSPSPGEDVPSCATVWTIGKKLPKDYKGCAAEDGAYEAPVITPDCVAIAYSDSLWAVPGGPVTQAAGFALDDPDFQAAC